MFNLAVLLVAAVVCWCSSHASVHQLRTTTTHLSVHSVRSFECRQVHSRQLFAQPQWLTRIDHRLALSDDTESLTRTLQLASNDHAVVIDTPCLDQVFANVSGFGAKLCALFDAERLQLDALVFVMSSRGQVMDANARKAHARGNKGRVTRRLAFVAKCEPGWLQKPRQRLRLRLQITYLLT